MISLMQQTAPLVVEHTLPHAPLNEAVAIVDNHHATETVGMPQLDPSSYGNQIFWLLVALGVTYWVLARIALPRISAVLADRQGAVSGDLMAAEEYKRRAAEASKAYDDALAEARTEAGKIVESNRAEMQDDIDAASAHADAEISARSAESEQRIGEIRASSLDNARQVAIDTAAELVRKFGGTADDAAVRAAVEAELKGAA